MNSFGKTCLFWAALAGLCACSSTQQRGPGHLAGYERVKIGRFQARALFREASVKLWGERAPVVVMIPGSGPMGPEEAMSGKLTADGQTSYLFLRYAEALSKAGYHTLLLGKPGVDYYSEGASGDDRFYSKEIYEAAKWQDLMDNVRDAIEWAQADPRVHPDRVWLLGHSEGTQVAVDVATTLIPLEGLMLLGFWGEDMKTTLRWQFVDRLFEHFFAGDVDRNKDGVIVAEEAAAWPEAKVFEEGETRVTLGELRRRLASDTKIQQTLSAVENSPLYSYGVFDRGPQYVKAALVSPPIYAFTGELDLQTPAKQAKKLETACKYEGKSNCYVKIVPGVGHAFSPPRPPRAHALLDLTLGPPTEAFLEDFSKTMKDAAGVPNPNIEP